MNRGITELGRGDKTKQMIMGPFVMGRAAGWPTKQAALLPLSSMRSPPPMEPVASRLLIREDYSSTPASRRRRREREREGRRLRGGDGGGGRGVQGADGGARGGDALPRRNLLRQRLPRPLVALRAIRKQNPRPPRPPNP